MTVTVYPSVPPRGIDVESGTRATVTFRVNMAVTDLTASIVTVQVPVPVQAPDQLTKKEFASEVAVNVTIVP